MAVTTDIPSWLNEAITKFVNGSSDSQRKRAAEEISAIFSCYIQDSGTDFNSPDFVNLCKRVIGKKMLKKGFMKTVEEQGISLDEAPAETTTPDEEVSDAPEEETLDEEELEEDEEDLDDLESDGDLDLEEDEDDNPEEESSDDSEDAEAEEEAEEVEGEGYEATGVATRDEVIALKGDFEYTHDFEDPAHASITGKILQGLGFTAEFDSRCGGTIKRPRGGKFVVTVNVADKKAVKRRGRLGPVLSYTDQFCERFTDAVDIIIDKLVSEGTAEE